MPNSLIYCIKAIQCEQNKSFLQKLKKWQTELIYLIYEEGCYLLVSRRFNAVGLKQNPQSWISVKQYVRKQKTPKGSITCFFCIVSTWGIFKMYLYGGQWGGSYPQGLPQQCQFGSMLLSSPLNPFKQLGTGYQKGHFKLHNDMLKNWWFFWETVLMHFNDQNIILCVIVLELSAVWPECNVM